jgi:hypothetical protein
MLRIDLVTEIVNVRVTNPIKVESRPLKTEMEATDAGKEVKIVPLHRSRIMGFIGISPPRSNPQTKSKTTYRRERGR